MIGEEYLEAFMRWLSMALGDFEMGAEDLRQFMIDKVAATSQGR